MGNLNEIIGSVKNGDTKAFEAMYNAYAQQVHFLALKLLKNEHDAAEITQEVFTTVFQKIGELQEPQAFPAWLNKITVNKCNRALQNNNAIVSTEDDISNLEFAEETDRSLIPDQALNNVAAAEILVQILDKLPLPQRVCIYYFYYKEMSIKEIAAELAVNENTVKSRLALGKAKIREELEKSGNEEGLKLYMATPFVLIPLLGLAASRTTVPEQVLGHVLSQLTMSASAAGTTGTAGATSATGATTTATSTISLSTIIVAVCGIVVISGIAAGLYFFGGDEYEPTVSIYAETSAFEPEATSEYEPAIAQETEYTQDSPTPLYYNELELEAHLFNRLNEMLLEAGQPTLSASGIYTEYARQKAQISADRTNLIISREDFGITSQWVAGASQGNGLTVYRITTDIVDSVLHHTVSGIETFNARNIGTADFGGIGVIFYERNSSLRAYIRIYIFASDS